MSSSPNIDRLLNVAAVTAPGSDQAILNELRSIVEAQDAKLLVADYSLRRIQEVNANGPVGAPRTLAGTIAGRALSSGDIIVSESNPTVVTVPLVDGAERIGLLELHYDTWNDNQLEVLEPVIAVFVMIVIARRRYSDYWAQGRRSVPLSPAAETQWDLLPPLSCSTTKVSVGGSLEPAYEIGGDSFDYALNSSRLEFAIIDAVGHGMSAVLMASVAINHLRNARRHDAEPSASYALADKAIADQFGDSFYVTAQIGSLDLDTGVLTWVNAGHVLPMLVRNGTYVGTLECAPSMPLGLGGPVVQIASESLQPGDRVLFYTDGITESKSPDDAQFGEDRLADFLVRAALEHVPVAETVRRLSQHIIEFVGDGLGDDATLFLIEYSGHNPV